MHSRLAPTLVTLCEDAFFAIAGAARLDRELLHAMAKRRGAALASAFQGAPPPGIESWEAWVLPLCTALAPLAPPRWLPMADVVDELSLEKGARGMRSLFTTKPSDKEIARVRAQGAMAVRALGAVLAATGTFHAEARLARATLIASLGLPEADQRSLHEEAPVPAEALDIVANVDSKVARAVVRGAFHTALGDGMDPREEQAILAIGRKLGLTTDEVNAARADARKLVDASKDYGEACVDAIRYVLVDIGPEADRLAIAAAKLTLPVVHRKDAVTAVNQAGPVTFGRKHQVDRRQRLAALGLAWVTAMRTDPTMTRRAELAARMNRVATDLGDLADAPVARNEIDRWLEDELGAAVTLPG